MEIIEKLESKIAEEINDMKDYAIMAIENKYEFPSLAHTLYTISTQEDAHHAALHAEAVKIISDYKKEHGEPPAPMQAVYDYIHKQHIKNLAEARRYQEIYKSK